MKFILEIKLKQNEIASQARKAIENVIFFG